MGCERHDEPAERRSEHCDDGRSSGRLPARGQLRVQGRAHRGGLRAVCVLRGTALQTAGHVRLLLQVTSTRDSPNVG